MAKREDRQETQTCTHTYTELKQRLIDMHTHMYGAKTETLSLALKKK